MNPEDVNLRPKHDLQKVVLFVLTVAGAVYAFGDKLLMIGKSSAALDTVQEIRKQQSSDHDDIAATRYDAKSANARLDRLESAVHDGFQDVNAQLRQLNLTHHR